MLTRPLYHGEVTWNRSRKRNAWGIKQQSSRPEQDWVRLEKVTALDVNQLRGDLEARLAQWQDLLGRHVAQARQILKKVLVGRIAFRRAEDGSYEFSGQASLGWVLARVACTKAGVAPTGTAHQTVGPFEVPFETLALAP